MVKKKLKIYLDTSVMSVYDDSRSPERQGQTRDFWKTLSKFDVYVSEITINEISKIPNQQRRSRLLGLAKKFSVLPLSEKAINLAQKYVAKKIVPPQYANDGLHLAIATVNKIDILVSWNCKHLVNLKTKREANAVNRQQGYGEIELAEPPMVKI